MDIEQILQKRTISIVYQPIQDVGNQQIFGFEALARGPGNLFYPLNLLRVAQKAGLFHEIEMLCLCRALEESYCLPPGFPVFINLSPETLLKFHLEVQSLIQKSGCDVVLELTEVGVSAKKQTTLSVILDDIRQRGIKIALDDIGAGDRNFRNICEITSDFLKIDRGLIQGLTKYKGSHYQSALKALVTIARDLDARVIAEGVETPAQLDVIQSTGIKLIQGFLISKPMPVSYWTNNKKEVTVC